MEEDEEFKLTPPPTGVKVPHHIAIAINHLVKQRDRAIVARDKADREIARLDAALKAIEG